MKGFRSFAAGMTACLLLSGCQSVYLHDPERATATADLKTKFGALTAPAFFDAQEKNLTDLAAREDRALADLLVTSRNYRLLNAIAPATTTTPASRARRLQDFVEHDLKASYGMPTLSAAQVQNVTTTPFVAQTASENIDFIREGVGDIAKMYKDAGGTRKTDCETVLASPPGDAADTLYSELRSACRTLYNANALTGGAGDAGPPVFCTLGATRGTLHEICLEGAALRNVASQKKRAAELEAAKKALVEAMKAKSSPEAENIARAEELIKQAEGLSEDERLKKILSHVEAVFGEELEGTINQLVADADSTIGKAAAPISAALKLLGAANELALASNRPASEYASALLIGLAQVRHDINILELDIATRKLDAEIVDREAAALRRQIYFLAQAQTALASRPRDRARAEAEGMTFYVRSLDLGRHPYELLTFRRSQLLRSAALKRARITDADYRRLIQPAIDQIAAYGAGGIKPETIADILSNLPVAGSILAE
jgi:hypothetical protein